MCPLSFKVTFVHLHFLNILQEVWRRMPLMLEIRWVSFGTESCTHVKIDPVPCRGPVLPRRGALRWSNFDSCVAFPGLYLRRESTLSLTFCLALSIPRRASELYVEERLSIRLPRRTNISITSDLTKAVSTGHTTCTPADHRGRVVLAKSNEGTLHVRRL